VTTDTLSALACDLPAGGMRTASRTSRRGPALVIGLPFEYRGQATIVRFAEDRGAPTDIHPAQ